MRAFIVISFCLIAVGSVLAEGHNFRVGKQYTFQSKSESIVGIPKLADQDAGYRMRRTITVIARDDETIFIVPKVQKIIEVREKANDDASDSSESSESDQQNSSGDSSSSSEEKEAQIPEHQKRLLEAPFEAKYRNGALQSLRTEHDTPEWVVNMQRALAQRFSLQIQQATDLNQRSKFTVTEETIYGKGPVEYIVAPPNPKRSRSGNQLTVRSLGRNEIYSEPYSSNSSSSESGKPHHHFRKGGCGPGPSANHPQRNDPCYRTNMGQTRPAPWSCSSYLQCPTDKCEWTEVFCDGGLYWDQSQEKCVPRLDADCANALFGDADYRIFAVHITTEKVLTDLMNGNAWDATTDIIVKDRKEPYSWNQVFHPKQLLYGGYFNFAFNKTLDSKYKVMTAVNGKPKSKIWTSENQPAQQWRALPTDQNNQYQIVNVLTRQALTVTDKSGSQGGLMVELQQSNQKDKAQLFRFDGIFG